MSDIARVLGVAAFVSLVSMPPSFAAETTRAVEFYNALQDHYFVSADLQEILDLDTGVHPGWRRTGLGFAAYPAAAAGGSAVCRFYIPPSLGDSHFYSASPAECAQTRARFPAFVYESADVFHAELPDATSGACPGTTIPVYRLWNGRADSNHRYTTDRAVWQRMRDAGWIAEGYGPDQAIMCAPGASTIPAVDLAVAGRAIVKARSAGGVIGVLQERLTSIFESGPDRTLGLLQPDGRTLRTYAAPAGWSIADFAVHPSGESSVVLTNVSQVRLVRLDRDGNLRSDDMLIDAAAATDPYFDIDGGIKDDDALQPVLMHDAARLAALGESVALVLRTGRNAVVAYRLDLDGNASYRRAWRTLVEPGASLFGVFLQSGSFDTFGQLQNHVELQVDATGDGTLGVAVVESPLRSFAAEAHSQYFAEPIAMQSGFLLTRIATADGRRLGTTAVDTQALSELHALRATAHGFLAVGRVRTQVLADGSGWNAFFAAVTGDGDVQAYRVLDVDRGEILFDATALADGRYLALGAAGYVQNPSGASISEDTQPLLLVLASDGSVAQRIEASDGPRQDQLRTVVAFDGRLLMGGMRNGPGTHSGDGQPQLITADGFLSDVVQRLNIQNSSDTTMDITRQVTIGK